MAFVLVSSKGQVVLPAPVRRRLGLGTGSRLEITEEPDGLRLRVAMALPKVNVSDLAGLVTAPSQGKPRRLQDFDAADLLARKPRPDAKP